MRFEVLCLLVLTVVCAIAQDAPVQPDGRLVVGTASYSFTTFTIVKYTTTITSTFTSVTTCTTSTAALITCTPSGGRRRRGLFYNADGTQRSRRGLFYDEEETEENEGSIFLPAAPEDNKSSDPVNEVPSKAAAADVVIPLEIQSGVSLPLDFSNSRFLVAFGTSTATSIVVATSTSSLTALCSSTTGFGICATTGK